MNADLRDEIAAALYFTSEVTGQGDATWPELIATYGDEYGAVVKYRAMAVGLTPLVERAQGAAWDRGYTSGGSNAMRRMSDEPNAPTSPNPYNSDAS